MSGYSEGGASVNKKSLKSWTPLHLSAKSDIERPLKTLRERAHDLAINSAIGAAAINTMTANVIGAGLKVFPRIKREILGISADEARAWSRRVKAEFDLWANDSDFLKRNNFYEQQRISFQSYLVDGDNFCLLKRKLPSAQNPYSLRLQLIEAGRVANPPAGGITEIRNPDNGNRIVNGVEVDSDGALTAIWVANRYWNEVDALDATLTFQRVEIFGRTTGLRNVLQICADTRADMYRGVPFLAPVIENLKQLSRYSEAELTSAIIRSYFSLFFIQGIKDYGINEITGSKEVEVTDYKLGAGTMNALPVGVDVKTVASSNQVAYDSFVTAHLKAIGAALNLPYEVLMKNFTSSYSASRAALLQAQSEFNNRKAAFINDFCKPIYEQFLIEAISIGRIDAPGFFNNPIKKAAWLNSEWYSQVSRVLDPQRETNAAILKLEHGLTTYEKVLAESEGLDFDDVLETLKQERELLKEVIADEEISGMN